MANETLGLMLPDLIEATPEDVAARPYLRETPLTEYLGAKVGQAFEMSIPGTLSQEQRILNLELEDQRSIYEKQMSKEDWESSRWHREGIQWNEEFTPARARVYAEDYDMRRYRESLIDRSPTGFRSVLGFGASMVGTALDPVNYLSLFGPAARAKAIMNLGEVGGRAAMSAAEAAIQTGVTDLAIFHRLNQQGEDLGWLDGAQDILFGAAVGGLFGAAGGVLHKRNVESVRRRLPMPMREEFGYAMEKALADTAAGEPVDVREILLRDWGRRATEVQTLSDLYEFSKIHPVMGDPYSPQVRLAFSELANELELSPGDLFVDRGEAKLVGGELRKDTHFGLVKILLKHGELSDRTPDTVITKEDILNLPHIIRDIIPDRYGDDLEWNIERVDGRQVTYVFRPFDKVDDEQHLLTIHVRDKDKEKPFSIKRKALESQSEGVNLGDGYQRGPLDSDARGRELNRPQRPGVTNNVTSGESLRNPDFTTERPHEIPPEMQRANPAGPDEARFTTMPKASRTEPKPGEAMGTTQFEHGLLPEEADAIRRARESGTLHPDDAQALADAERMTQQMDRYADAYLVAADCLMK